MRLETPRWMKIVNGKSNSKYQTWGQKRGGHQSSREGVLSEFWGTVENAGMAIPPKALWKEPGGLDLGREAAGTVLGLVGSRDVLDNQPLTPHKLEAEHLGVLANPGVSRLESAIYAHMHTHAQSVVCCIHTCTHMSRLESAVHAHMRAHTQIVVCCTHTCTDMCRL